MRSLRAITGFVLLIFMVVLVAGPAEAAIPGLGKFLGRFLGKGATKQVAQKSAGRAISGKVIGGAVKVLPQASKSLLKAETEKILARSAPKTWLPKVTPDRILAVGGAGAMVLAGNSTANAIENVGSATADSVRKVGERAAETLPDITTKAQNVAFRGIDAVSFYLFLLVVVIMTMLFWRFKMMPWHAVADKPTERGQSGSVSVCSEVKDAEIIEVEANAGKTTNRDLKK